MKTPQLLYPEMTEIHICELEHCPTCGGTLKIAYQSHPRMVQRLSEVDRLIHRPKRCGEVECNAGVQIWPAASWRHSALRGCGYGYDVIAQIGWLRQIEEKTFGGIHQKGLPCFCQRIGALP